MSPVPHFRPKRRAAAGSALLAIAVVAAAPLHAQPATPLTMHQVMADPDWIGPPVEQAWWSWDGATAYYTLKRDGSTIRDIHARPIAGGTAQRLEGAARGDIDGMQPVVDPQRRRMAFVRNGDVYVRALDSGALTQLTRTDAVEGQLQWGSDGALAWRSGNDWFRWSGGPVAQAAVLKTEDDPAKPPGADDLRERQLRYFETLRVERERREAMREQSEEWRIADPSQSPPPIHLGKDLEISGSAMSPDGRWVLVATQAKDADEGQDGKMPKYITESGYEEFEDARTRVGRNDPVPQALWLVSMADGQLREVKLDALPGIGEDPLADLRRTAKQDPLKGNRAVRLETFGPDASGAIRWSDDSRNVAMMLHAVDNKDRWLATVDLGDASLRTRHRLSDPAWINWSFNEFGWMPDNRTTWFLSEESGWSHLYLSDGGRARALTRGEWEVSRPELSADGNRFVFVCNRARPGDYELCAVDAAGGEVRELTALGGVENFVRSPDDRQLLVRHSASYLPPQLSVVDAAGGTARQLTDTRTPAFAAMDWLQPEYVQVPSKQGAGTLWGKYYGPANPEPGRQYPVVLFVHGAGYLQNVSDRYPNYFREQMFHNLLVQQGYIVLDLDFRASEGYGRDWRTAIYRDMGTPELQDYMDGIDWLVANRQADRDRVGIYGGSYGGFVTFMAMFREPDTFKAGAALRPVSDWSQYNHEYTANILNTPALDPEAYRRSSPMEYADGLEGGLLIAHGMIDDNVFFRDSVMVAQKLIELRKHDWELAPYPMERHAFVHPSSWYDEYRRIFELFERTLK